ncbi:super-infection exclusion protein B [Lysinibacillus sp. NPDC056959]|uniref:super-infection exclusion protein B n=1 Tax=Lysinibacillus sp. NPDC056959 TaxID=3345981 RepID=UPI00362CBF43
MDIAKIILTFIYKIKIILWPIFLLSIALTFMPGKWITYLSINDLVNKNKAWISITLLISSAFVLVELFLLVKNAFTSHFAKREAKKNMKNRLLNLSDTQNFIVHHLFAENTPSGLYLNIMHPEVMI